MPAKTVNGGLLLIVGLPLFAIAASVGTSIVAFTRGDSTLPGDYHWEGMQLDHDFADAQRAFDLDVRANLQMPSTAGICRVLLQINAPLPRALQLSLVHGTQPALDRQVELSRVGSAYEGECGMIPPGHWHVELGEPSGKWRVRQDVSGVLDGTIISAR